MFDILIWCQLLRLSPEATSMTMIKSQQRNIYFEPYSENRTSQLLLTAILEWSQSLHLSDPCSNYVQEVDSKSAPRTGRSYNGSIRNWSAVSNSFSIVTASTRIPRPQIAAERALTIDLFSGKVIGARGSILSASDH